MRRAKKALILCLVLGVTLILLPGLLGAQELGKVNINKASVEELTQLKGIGPEYAERIIEYREQNGSFEKPEDIMKVHGIGEKTWKANKDHITVE